MSKRNENQRTVSPAARVFSSLQAEEALLPGRASALRRSGAVVLALLVLGAFPLYLAANAAGLIGDTPTALAKGSNSGPGGGDDDDGDSSGPGGNSGPGGGDDDTGTQTRTGHNRAEATDDTSANGHSTRGTTNDNDTNTRLGTDDTSGNGHSTRGTTNDNDTNTNTRNSATGTRTRTGS
jgi:hypothetical protein